jgi:hypothetical protein
MSRAFVVVRSPADRSQISRWAAGVPTGTTVEFKAPRRNPDQNALMWVLLGHVAKQVEWYGQYLTSEDWKDVLTASLRQARVVPGIEPRTFVPLGMRTSDMTKEEFSQLIELIYAFGAERGVDFYDKAEGAAQVAA